jgi:hypothetical protein
LNSKDLGLTIILAALGFVTMTLIVQAATMLTGIPGANYVFTIVIAIQTSFALLIYRGKRWRFFVQMTLLTFLIIPTYIGGVPFDLLSKINLAVNAFHGDLLFNSIYRFFREKNKLIWWAILITVEFWLMNPIFGLIIKPFFYPPEFIKKIVETVTLLLPVIIVEAIAGGYIGYKIYRRVDKLG